LLSETLMECFLYTSVEEFTNYSYNT